LTFAFARSLLETVRMHSPLRNLSLPVLPLLCRPRGGQGPSFPV